MLRECESSLAREKRVVVVGGSGGSGSGGAAAGYQLIKRWLGAFSRVHQRQRETEVAAR